MRVKAAEVLGEVGESSTALERHGPPQAEGAGLEHDALLAGLLPVGFGFSGSEPR